MFREIRSHMRIGYGKIRYKRDLVQKTMLQKRVSLGKQGPKSGQVLGNKVTKEGRFRETRLQKRVGLGKQGHKRGQVQGNKVTQKGRIRETRSKRGQVQGKKVTKESRFRETRSQKRGLGKQCHIKEYVQGNQAKVKTS